MIVKGFIPEMGGRAQRVVATLLADEPFRGHHIRRLAVRGGVRGWGQALGLALVSCREGPQGLRGQGRPAGPPPQAVREQP